MSRRPFQEPSAPRFADELAITRRHFPADRHDVGAAFDFEALERIVIEVHLMRAGGNSAAIVGIINDQIGVVSRLDRPFAREETEQFCRIRAGGGDELVKIDATAFHPVSKIKIDPVFERRNAIRNFGEVIPAHDFLGREIERRMIRREGRDKTLAQPIPKHGLVFLVAQRR